jgi:TRAP-type uncharacterized transport system fused permease subunit
MSAHPGGGDVRAKACTCCHPGVRRSESLSCLDDTIASTVITHEPTFFSLQIIAGIFFAFNAYSYFILYRKKKNPDYPILPREVSKYLYKSHKHFLRIYLIPFFMWKIIFEHHKDKELNDTAKRVRWSVFIFIGIGILASVLIIVTTPNLNFRLP